jgi:hypothetical protein
MSFKFPPRHFKGAKSETFRIEQAVIDWVKQTAPSVLIELCRICWESTAASRRAVSTKALSFPVRRGDGLFHD